MATAKKGAKKSGATKGGAKKGAAKKSGKKKGGAKSGAKKKDQPSVDPHAELMAKHSQENADHKAKLYEKEGLPPTYTTNPNESDSMRSSEVGRHEAAMHNRAKYQEEAKSQKES